MSWCTYCYTARHPTRLTRTHASQQDALPYVPREENGVHKQVTKYNEVEKKVHDFFGAVAVSPEQHGAPSVACCPMKPHRT